MNLRSHTKKLLALGECMIELSHRDENTLKMGFAGDTLNMAIYLARYRNKTHINVFYGTALGCDPYSEQMLEFCQSEGIDTSLVKQIPDKLPGLYLIRTDTHGERTFYFYRSDSAARQFFHASQLETLQDHFLNMDIIYFSGIGLAIWDESSRIKLFSLIQKARQHGIQICFDSNYRAKLWPDTRLAQQLIQKAWSLSDIYLPTFEDHKALFHDSSPEALTHRLIHDESLKEVVVKDGANGCWIGYQGQIQWVPACTLTKIVDTTAAGDSFNAGYLSARLQGFEPLEAAKLGHRLAAQVVSFPGAIIPESEMPDLLPIFKRNHKL